MTNFFTFLISGIFSFFLVSHVQGNGKNFSGSTEDSKLVEKIAATVNADIITLLELNQSLEDKWIVESLKGNKIDVRSEVLEDMITRIIEKNEAMSFGISINEEQIYDAVKAVALHNRITVSELYNELEMAEINLNTYKKHLKHELIKQKLKKHVIEPKIFVTDNEVDEFLPTYEQMKKNTPEKSDFQSDSVMFSEKNNQFYTLAQILIQIPDGCSKFDEDLLFKKGQGLIDALHAGADFHTVLASISNENIVSSVRILGTKLLNEWPDLFIQAIQNLNSGQISNLLKSENGFHIIKVLNRFSKNKESVDLSGWVRLLFPERKISLPPLNVAQTNVKHILIQYSCKKNQELDKQYLELIRSRIIFGLDDFETLAYKFSQDSFAKKGGDMGWVSPGFMLPSLENAMNTLEAGEISQIISSSFGFHLIKVQERRVRDLSEEKNRELAHNFLREKRIQSAYDDWIKNLRKIASVEIFLQDQIDQLY